MKIWLNAGVWAFAAVWGVAQARAQETYPAERSIGVGEVEVRSGPSTQYYATSKLRSGERIIVIREFQQDPRWLCIKPPAGSFSWIAAKHVRQIDAQTAFVKEGVGAAPVLPGSSLVDRRPDVESVKLPPGHQLVVLDRPFQVDGENWLAVQPPPTEVRYIPASAIQGSPVTVSSNGFFPKGVATKSVLDQADQAYVSGNFDLARQLYREAVDRATDQNQRTYAQNRLAQLGQPTNNYQYAGSQNPYNTTGGSNGGNWQPAGAVGQKPLASSSGYGIPNGATTTPTGYAPQQPLGAASWSQYGVLRQAGFQKKDGQQVFALEKDNKVITYAVAQQGTSLTGFVGRQVSLYGPAIYNNEGFPPVQMIVASHVAVP